MFHKVKNAFPLKDFKLNVQFSDGSTKVYDVEPLFKTIPAFRTLQDNPKKFYDVTVDTGGYGIMWNDELDLSCDELWQQGNPS